ncbi:GNAT family N-acetyltransferase [Actinacidiphila acidipaludis]|uniref:N-acetyltransferase n=1 Tax=Actinacidiphila acidipaludis TaxID=2873382 RepID=A0ABS7Q2K0_9ACTN|nr:GNAT family N-acetyltransferase [Streptomyces acidipaludis]MBY8877363.1 N-acetyltransferase [Streptomyces acidipaludis]
MTGPTEPNHPTADFPARNRPGAPAFDFDLVNDQKTGVYEARTGGTEVAGLTYQAAGANRIVLLATAVLPEFRHQGIATELIRRVLDDVRAQGKTVTITCPIVRTFIEHHPAYADLVDHDHPGAGTGVHGS